MPKIKTHRGAAKRFRKTKSGKLARAKAYRGHLFISKNSRRKRALRKSTLVSAADRRRMRSLLPGL